MLYDDDAGNVSKSAEGLAKSITVVGTVCESAGLTVAGNKTEQCFHEHQTDQATSRHDS